MNDPSKLRASNCSSNADDLRSNSERTAARISAEPRTDSVLKEAIDVVVKARIYNETYAS